LKLSDRGTALRIGLITSAPPRSRYGNRIIAERWACILRELRHCVTVAESYDGEQYDLLVALEARRSVLLVSST